MTRQIKQQWMIRYVVLGWLAASTGCQIPPVISPTATIVSAPTDRPTNRSAIRYQVHDLPRSKVYTVLIPANSEFAVLPAISPETASLEQFVQQHGAIAAINGGFFDPQNQQSTSYVMLKSKWVGDPTQNQRLMGNPDLAPYLDQILNRSEFRRYQCDRPQYAIARHDAEVPSGCQLLEALGAGPQILPELTLELEGFTDTDANGAVIRDALGSSQPNARSAIGITADGSLLWVMAAQKPGITPSGLSLPELAAFLKSQGAETAINLDGGSSSGLVYEQQSIHGKLDVNGEPIQRPVKSVLLLVKLDNHLPNQSPN